MNQPKYPNDMRPDEAMLHELRTIRALLENILAQLRQNSLPNISPVITWPQSPQPPQPPTTPYPTIDWDTRVQCGVCGQWFTGVHMCSGFPTGTVTTEEINEKGN